ncbi:MAG: ABC transporter permease [Ruminococcus sp.]
MNIFKELYLYRTMIASLVRKDLKGRYKGSVLGFLWTFINPLLQLGVYTLVFQMLLKNPMENYYMHLFVALVPWIFFSSALTTGSKAVLGQANMVKKIYFPREVMPISYATSSFVNMLLSFVIIFAVLIISPIKIHPLLLLWLPYIMFFQYFLVVGVTMITSSVTVYLRDLEHIMSVLTQAWMYASPVVYPIDYIPERYRNIYLLNPMSPIILAYRDVLYFGKCPETKIIILIAAESTVVLIAGFLIFHKLKKHFAEEL